jgi:hypothetical protein
MIEDIRNASDDQLSFHESLAEVRKSPTKLSKLVADGMLSRFCSLSSPWTVMYTLTLIM